MWSDSDSEVSESEGMTVSNLHPAGNESVNHNPVVPAAPALASPPHLPLPSTPTPTPSSSILIPPTTSSLESPDSLVPSSPHLLPLSVANSPGSLQDETDDITDTNPRVQEALTGLQLEECLQIEHSSIDIEDEMAINNFLTKGCGCRWNCHMKLERGAIQRRRASCSELSNRELDMVMLGQLAASEIGGVQRARSSFHFEGKRVCKAAFLLLHGIGEKRFKNLKKHFSDFGLSPR